MPMMNIAHASLFALFFTPNTKSIVSAYVSTGLPPHVHWAWLQRMTGDICQSPIGNLTPEMLETTPKLISAWSQNPYSESGKKGPSYGRECALEVERLLKRLADERRAGNENAVGTTVTYNYALAGWANSGEGGGAAQRAENILMEMQDLYNRGDVNIQPNIDSFKYVISAWANSGEKHAPQRAQRVLEWMLSVYELGENDFASPDAECFAIVLNCYAKSGQVVAARKTEKILLWQERLYKAGYVVLQPQTDHYNAVVTAWSLSDEDISVDRAYEILEHMENLERAGMYDVRPNLTTYTNVIRACAKKGSRTYAMRAQDALDRLERKYRKGDLSPDRFVYNFAIDAWTKSNDDLAPYKAKQILQRLIKINAENGDELSPATPDACTYTSVISAAASTKKTKLKTQSFKIALWTFEQLSKSKYTRPTDVTYGVMLKACARLIPNESKREKDMIEIFRQCKDNGLVSKLVVTWLQKGVSAGVFQELMEKNSKNRIPKEWSKRIGRVNRTMGRYI